MAQEKFSDFTSASSCGSSDRIAGYNGSDNYQYTPSQIADNISDGVVTTDKLATEAVTTVKIDDAAVTTAKIATQAVTTAKIADQAITQDQIADDEIITVKLQDSCVTTDKIADSNVTTAKIADSNVTRAKLAATVLPKQYVALISQSSTSAPTLTIIKNDFSGTITASRNGAGDYTLTNSLAEFTANKTTAAIDNSTNYAVKFTGATRTGNTTISLATFNSGGSAADTLLLNDILTIEVYS